MILADTSFIVDIMRGDIEAKKLETNYSSQGYDIIVSTLSIFELYIGVSKGGFPKREETKIRNALSRLVTIEFDEASAKEAAKILIELEQNGQRIEHLDILLAGIARTKGIPVITRNIAHFNRITGLLVESY